MAAKTTRKDPVERKEGDERKKALNAALASIEKQFGKGAIMRMADGVEQQNIEVVSTGSLGLDLALGVGGLPRGRIVEIYGPESSGKTTLSLQVIAEMQKIGGTCFCRCRTCTGYSVCSASWRQCAGTASLSARCR